MGNEVAFCYFHISVLILETTQNLIQPEYSVKLLNTEKLVFSLGDVNADNDLELVKKVQQDPELEGKLKDFHSFMEKLLVTDNPVENYYREQNVSLTYPPEYGIAYPESPADIAMNEKHLAMLERRMKKDRKNDGKKKKKKRRMHLEYADFPEVSKRRIQKRGFANNKGLEDNEEENEKLEKQYREFALGSIRNNTAFKYTDEGKPEENFKDVIKKITDLKIPKNCTNVTGVGVQAVECIIRKFENQEVNKTEFLKKISMIMLAWLGIYLAVAVPLWCAKGWCCCCCRCAFCFPHRTVKEIQKYISENPPGVYVNSDGEEEHYNATGREIQLYEKLKRSIADF